MDDIDALLTEGGATWRASQPAFDEEAALSGTMARAARTASRLQSITAVILVLIVGAIGVALVGRPWSDMKVGTNAVSVGDHVEGAGSVIVSQPHGAQLCLPGFGRLVPGQPPTCSPVKVPLVGLDTATLPGRQVVGDVIFSRWVSIIGSWNGQAAVVDSVEASAPPAETLEDPPCRPTAIPSDEATPLMLERETRRIGDVLSADPDLYAGYWSARDPASGPSAPPVLVVGTVGDPEVVRAGLMAAPWLPLCVVDVLFSSRQLLSLTEELRRGHPDWSIDVDHRQNRVRVKLAIVTPEIRTEMAKVAGLSIDPLIRPIGDQPPGQ